MFEAFETLVILKGLLDYQLWVLHLVNPFSAHLSKPALEWFGLFR